MNYDGGITRLRKRMKALPDHVRKAVQPALLKSANETAGDMKALAESSKDTGALIDSIEITKGGQRTPAYSQPGGSSVVPDNAVAITTGNTEVRYPHLVEYGTVEAPAQPYFWPAVRLNAKKTKDRISRAMSKAIRDNWGKS